MYFNKLRSIIASAMLSLCVFSTALHADLADAFGPLSIADPTGNLLTTWRVVDNTNGVVILKGRLYTAGDTWGPTFNISDDANENVISSPRMVADSEGNIMIVWVSYVTSGELFLVRSRSIEKVSEGEWGSWGSIQNVSDPLDGNTAIADFILRVDNTGAFYTTWTSYLNGADHSSILTAKADSYDASWSGSSQVSD